MNKYPVPQRKRIYLAGKITQDNWRAEIVPQLQDLSNAEIRANAKRCAEEALRVIQSRA